MKKGKVRPKNNGKIKRKSAGTNKGCRYVMGTNGLVPVSWYNKGS